MRSASAADGAQPQADVDRARDVSVRPTGSYYYAVPDNIRALQTFRETVIRHWLRALRRRSQRSRMTWERMRRIGPMATPRPHPASLADRAL